MFLFMYRCKEAEKICPSGKPWWGARAIIENGSYSILSDRQSMSDPDTEGWEEFKATMNGGALKAARECFTDIVTFGYPADENGRRKGFRWADDREITLYEDDDIKIIANPRGSHGYLYMFAYRKQDLEIEDSGTTTGKEAGNGREIEEPAPGIQQS